MNVIVQHDKIRAKDGRLQPVRYVDATYAFAGSLLEITCGGLGSVTTVKIPREHVVSVHEERESPPLPQAGPSG